MKTSRRLSIFLTAGVLLLFVAYFLDNKSQFKPLLDINVVLLVAIGIFDILMILANGLFTKFVLEPFKKHISLRESFYVSLISSVGNFFAPVGAGFGFRAVYLKRRHGLSYSHYISTLTGNYIIVFFVNSLAGLSALFLLKDRFNSQYLVLVVAFAAVFVFSLFLGLVKLPRIKWGAKKPGILGQITRNLHAATEGWSQIVSNKKLLVRLTALVILNLLLTMAATFAVIKSLHFSVGITPLLLFSVLGSLSLFINITPANLGIKEAIYLFSSGILGFSTAQILSIALVDRGVVFLVLAGLWLVSHKIRSPIPKLVEKAK